MRMQAWLVILALAAGLAGCGGTPVRAPVADRGAGADSRPAVAAGRPAAKPAPVERDWRPATYTVKKGDTLYSLALEFGFDYRELAEWNGIGEPYIIRVGQVLRLAPPDAGGTTPLRMPPPSEVKPLPAAQPPIKTEPKALREPYSEQALARLRTPSGETVPAPPAQAARPEAVEKEKATASAGAGEERPAARVAEKSAPRAADETASEEMDPDRVEWTWPAQGKIIAGFGEGNGNKGLDIAGTLGQPVVAAASGKVVHTGTTLRGYGKLIIIKHNRSYFSVYAHNSQILVKEGQNVVRGQKIAEMGDTDTDRVKLHFEIRRLGKPVDPLKYLPNDRTS